MTHVSCSATSSSEDGAQALLSVLDLARSFSREHLEPSNYADGYTQFLPYLERVERRYGEITLSGDQEQRLHEALRAPSALVRYHGAFVVARTDSAIRGRAVPRLIELLAGDPHDQVRWASAAALGRCREQAEIAAPALLTALRDDRGEWGNVRQRAIAALARLGIPYETMKQSLGSGYNNDPQFYYNSMICYYGRDVITAHFDLLSSPEARYRRFGVRSLCELFRGACRTGPLWSYGVSAPEDGRYLQALLADSDAGVRAHIALVIVYMGLGNTELVPFLLETLRLAQEKPWALMLYKPWSMTRGRERDTDGQRVEMLRAQVRYEVIRCLGKLGANEPAVTGVLHDALRNDNSADAPRHGGLQDDSRLRRAAVRALGKVRPVDPASVEHLVVCLSDAEDRVQMAAVEALGALGESARSAVPALMRAARLDTVPDGSAAPVNEDAMSESSAPPTNKELRLMDAAAFALHKVAPDFPDPFHLLMPRVMEVISNPNAGSGSRADAILTLARCGNKAVPALPLLLNLVKDPDFYIREAVAIAASLLGPLAEPLYKSLGEQECVETETPVRHAINYARDRISGCPLD